MAHLMDRVYSKPCEISLRIWQSQKSLFGYFQAYTGTNIHLPIFSHVYGRDNEEVKANQVIFMHYCGMLSHIHSYSELCVTLTYTIVSYSNSHLEPETPSKAWGT